VPLLAACFILLLWLAYSLNLKLEATYFSETYIDVHHSTEKYTPKAKSLHKNFCESLKSLQSRVCHICVHTCDHLAKNEAWLIYEYNCRGMMMLFCFTGIHKTQISDAVWTWGELALALCCHLLSNTASTAVPLADDMTLRKEKGSDSKTLGISLK
jgi:hypothetical protein